MELTYINESGGSVTIRQMKPIFLSRLDGVRRIRQTIYTFRAPEQDGAFYISSSLDMRNITIEGQIIADSVDASFVYRLSAAFAADFHAETARDIDLP